MSNSPTWHLLPPDLIELQLGQIDLLLAMYPDDIMIEDSAQNVISIFRRVVEGDSSEKLDIPPSVPILLQIVVPNDSQTKNTLDLDLTIPFFYQGSQQPEDPPDVKVRIQQPPWLSRAVTTQLMDDLPLHEDLLGTIEHIKETAAKHLSEPPSSTLDLNTRANSIPNGPLVRVWFYFPSISTRSKRADFIIHAPSYSLTGFLYAGKPGLLCVEGASQEIDDYMRFIKTESWGDIPAHHKKVSERYREPDVQRVFKDMEEITDSVGERRGVRANRGDMRAVEEWLADRGLGEALGRVLM
ncbi:hypothetical protein DE146DRAFT_749848 [Phaeosphaeria sp. MPI-PUGE-AT-0046c]|nr:hypothetical protein DE146DRAFT_749848 [Phaeosphaeria sp. MPI-PUGE-AT-0046c]